MSSSSETEISIDEILSSTPEKEIQENPINFIQIKNTKTEIKYVYHLSDIHIRNIQRHNEYREVFSRTYTKIQSLIGNNKDKSLIVLTGDIVHTKTELSPEAVSLTHHFFKNLSEIAPVILIPGNHDCNLSNRNRMDALTPIVDDIGNFDDLFYLKNSGFYQYNNIIFGVTSIFDNILITANKIDIDMIGYKNKFKIGLYHGQVHGAKTDVGYRMNNEELLVEHFKGYDYVFLGDIHKFQYMDEECTIAYAGSLIQQSYGESLDNHGFIKWDLFDGESSFYNVKNDYGYCTINIVDGKMIPSRIPPKPRIRFIQENTNQIQYQEIVEKLEKEYKICEIVKDSNFKTNKTPKETKIATCDTQENMIMKYLKSKLENDTKINQVLELHKNIYEEISNETINYSSEKKQNWNILKLEFSNVLSYGKDNVIDFSNYDKNKIIGIVAPNYYGKSAILDIILFCLFERMSRGNRSDILNKNRNTMYCSILFKIGNKKYMIERLGKRSKNKLSVKIDVNFYLVKENKNKLLNGLKPNDTNKKICELIGNYDDYLTTCFCLQRSDENSSNFLDMKNTPKKEYLYEMLKLNVFEDCHKYAKKIFNELVGEVKMKFH